MSQGDNPVPIPGEQKKPIRVYVDMVGDLWHFGHVNFCRQAKALGDYLIVGINKDEDCIGYKRKPILNTMERVKSAMGCKYVDEVIWEDVELVVTKEFIKKHNIDIVAHGNDFTEEKLKKYYPGPLELDTLRGSPPLKSFYA